MKRVEFGKGKMMFFNMDSDGVMVSVPSKKHLIIKLCDYMSDNGMENVDFIWNGGEDKVTVWCHHNLGDLTNVYLVGVMSRDTWDGCGWVADTPNPLMLHFIWNKETKVFNFTKVVEKILE